MTERSDQPFRVSWQFLRSRPYLTTALLIYAALNISYLFLVPAQYLADFDYYFAELILLVVAVPLFVRAAVTADDSNVRAFWILLTVGLAGWLLARILSFVTQSWSSSQFEILKDFLFLIYFGSMVFAIELQLHRNPTNAWIQRCTATAVGSVLLVFAVFCYFAILPTIASGVEYATLYGVHAVLDGYLAVRFFMAAMQTGHRSWRSLYALLSTALALIVAADMLSWSYRNGVQQYLAGDAKNLLWFTWYPFVYAAASIPMERLPPGASKEKEQDLLPMLNATLITGLALPLIHAVGYGFDVLSADAHRIRDLFVAGWIIVFAALLLGSYIVVRARLGVLDHRREEAEQKAGRFEDQLNRELRIRSLGRLSAGLAHDFGNTIAAIAIFAKTIAGKIERGEPVATDMRGLTEGIDYANNLIGKLKTFAAASENVATGSVSVSEEIARTIDVIRPSLPARVHLEFVDRAAGVIVHADGGMIHQVVTNYVYNAIDAVGSAGKIEVRIAGTFIDTDCSACGEPVAGRHAVLHVSDTGSGVADSILEQIFEPLVTTKPVGQGSGLGLSTVSGIMHNIGGHVGVANNRNGGATFFAYFPLQRKVK